MKWYLLDVMTHATHAGPYADFCEAWDARSALGYTYGLVIAWQDDQGRMHAVPEEEEV
jgi:hypothetical protein